MRMKFEVVILLLLSFQFSNSFSQINCGLHEYLFPIDNQGNFICYPCAINQYTNTTNSTSCLNCPEGYYRINNTLAGIDTCSLSIGVRCSNGTFYNATSNQCQVCSAQKYTVNYNEATCSHNCSVNELWMYVNDTNTINDRTNRVCNQPVLGYPDIFLTQQLSSGQMAYAPCPEGTLSMYNLYATSFPNNVSLVPSISPCGKCTQPGWAALDYEYMYQFDSMSILADVIYSNPTFWNAYLTYNRTFYSSSAYTSWDILHKLPNVGGRTCYPCLRGNFAQTFVLPAGDNYTMCVPCVYPTVTLTDAQTSCIRCPAGTRYGDLGTCLSCQPGSIRPNSTAYDVCTFCVIGTYEVNRTTCLPCANGTVQSNPGQDFCSPCAAGTYSSVDHTLCIPCPLNQYAPAGSSQCYSCPLGTVIAANLSVCIPDPHPNIWNISSISSYCANNASACLPCPLGFIGQYPIAMGVEVCPPCPVGTSTFTAGSSVCTSCPLGQELVNPGSCSVCSPTNIMVRGTNDINCKSCADYQIPDDINSQCVYCGAGLYWLNHNCVSCPLGTYRTYSISASEQTCKTCPAASFSLPGSSSCTACPAGTIVTAVQDSCTFCGPGTIRASTSDPNVCTPCPPGTYETDRLTCVPCAAGTYNNRAGMVGCTPCIPGTYAKTTGSTSCIPCPIGTIQDSSGQADCDACPFLQTTTCVQTSDNCTYDVPVAPDLASLYINDPEGFSSTTKIYVYAVFVVIFSLYLGNLFIFGWYKGVV